MTTPTDAPAPVLTVRVAVPQEIRIYRLTPVVPDNPFGKTHGAPSDSERHVGDLGNFKTDGQGNAKGSVSDSLIKLFGEHSVLGVS